jgi:hypothetical protein
VSEVIELEQAIRERWPDEFKDGARCAFLRRFDGRREAGGYPLGFHSWPLERRNAWFAGFNRGLCDRFRAQNQKETPCQAALTT